MVVEREEIRSVVDQEFYGAQVPISSCNVQWCATTVICLVYITTEKEKKQVLFSDEVIMGVAGELII